MKSAYMLNAEEVAERLGISKAHAYKVIRQLNDELKANGYIVVSGKIPKAFWDTKFFGNNHFLGQEQEAKYAGL